MSDAALRKKSLPGGDSLSLGTFLVWVCGRMAADARGYRMGRLKSSENVLLFQTLFYQRARLVRQYSRIVHKMTVPSMPPACPDM